MENTTNKPLLKILAFYLFCLLVLIVVATISSSCKKEPASRPSSVEAPYYKCMNMLIITKQGARLPTIYASRLTYEQDYNVQYATIGSDSIITKITTRRMYHWELDTLIPRFKCYNSQVP